MDDDCLCDGGLCCEVIVTICWMVADTVLAHAMMSVTLHPSPPTPPLGCWTIDCACYDGLCHEVVVSLCSVQPSEVLDDFSCYDGICHDVSHCSSQPSRWSMVVNAVWWHMPWS